MKILHLVLCVDILILAHTACGQQYATLPNQRISQYKRYILSPVAIKVSASSGRQLPWRRTIPLVPQGDSVAAQPTGQVSLLEIIALALNLGNTLFAAPPTQAQRDPASSVAAGVTTGILNYISTQNAGGQSQTTFNDPVQPNRIGINMPQNTNTNMADSAAVSKVRQYKWSAFPFEKDDWDWEWEWDTEEGTNKNFKRFPMQHMTNLNIFVNKGPQSQQVFNRMKNSQKMKPRVFGSFSFEKEQPPQRVIVLVPDYHRHPTHSHYRPSHSYYPSHYPSHHPSHHPSYHQYPHYPSHHYPPPSQQKKKKKKQHYHEEEYSVPVILEDDDEDDETEEDDDEDEEEYKRSDESSKEGLKTDELEKINNRLKQKKILI